MKVILASEAMEACARVLDGETEEFGAPRHQAWECEQAVMIYAAAARIAAQPHDQNPMTGTDFRVPVPDWIAARALS